MTDVADLASLSTPVKAARAPTGTRAPELAPSGGAAALATLPSPAAPEPVVRSPDISGIDML